MFLYSKRHQNYSKDIDFPLYVIKQTFLEVSTSIFGNSDALSHRMS